MAHLINQPWDGRGKQLGDELIRLLTQVPQKFTSFRICVAFAKASGILRLVPALKTFMENGGRIEIVVGIDENITSKQALDLLKKYSTVTYVFNNPAATFHPKLYLFEAAHEAIAFIGSSNLTTGGLFTNYEVDLELKLNLLKPEEQQIFFQIASVFSKITDLTTGNCKTLDENLIAELFQTKQITNEARRRSKQTPRKTLQVGNALFPRLPVPPAPSIDPELAYLIPKTILTRSQSVAPEVVIAFRSWKTFMMTLGPRDTRQQKGYSRDIYIPLAARDAHQDFWGWPHQYSLGTTSTLANYLERRIRMLIRPVTGQIMVAENVRLYYYETKHEFRLNCGRLIEGAQSNDILVIQKSPVDVLFEDQPYEFEATIISSTHPIYVTFVNECHAQVQGSQKRWGYL